MAQRETNIKLDKHDRDIKSTNNRLEGTREDIIEKVAENKDDLIERLA